MRIERAAPGVDHAYRTDGGLPFDPVVFDRDALARRGLLTGQADAGRGNTVFFDWHGAPLVLREYRRGGAMQRLSKRHYVSVGRERSRPVREFRLLYALEQAGLPVSCAFAALRVQHGLLETGALVTHRVQGQTLAARLVVVPDPAAAPLLDAVGLCLARFHRAGGWHADLNAHNLIVADDRVHSCVTLIDLDRGRLGEPALGNTPSSAARANVARLRRSFVRVLDARTAERVGARLEQAWLAAYASLGNSAAR